MDTPQPTTQFPYTAHPGLLYKAIVLVIVVVPILAMILAIVLLWNHAVHWRDIALLLGMHIPISLGVTIGFHRMLTHRSFRAHPVVKFILLILGSMAIEGSAIQWAATHTKHHAQADKEGDPHSPVEGFFHAHIGWMFGDRTADPNVLCRHLLKDDMILFISRTFPLWFGLSLLIPLLLGGWTGFLWGGLVRIFLVHHITWSVNSVCHTFGKREFETPDKSRNEWIVGLIGLGEGWHNNHHAFPRSAFHGLHWWQFDLSAYVIRLFALLKLASDVKSPTKDEIKKRKTRSSLVLATRTEIEV